MCFTASGAIRGMSDGTDHTNKSISTYHYWTQNSFCVVRPALSSRIWVERKEEVRPGYGRPARA
jgi:predicted transcriptional regulator